MQPMSLLSRPGSAEGNANPAGCSNYQPPRQRSCPILSQVRLRPAPASTRHKCCRAPIWERQGFIGVHLLSLTSPSEARSRASKSSSHTSLAILPNQGHEVVSHEDCKWTQWKPPHPSTHLPELGLFTAQPIRPHTRTQAA